MQMLCQEQNYGSQGSSPSPPSSPAYIDSSPPASPLLELDETPSIVQSRPEALPHPLAASFNANRALPLYEKKGKQNYGGLRSIKDTKGRQILPPTKKLRSYEFHELKEKEAIGDRTASFFQVIEELSEREELIWDAAVQRVLDTGSRKIELSDCQLTSIPKSFVNDLEKVVVLPESQENAKPSSAQGLYHSRAGDISTRPEETKHGLPRTREFLRSHTAPELLLGTRAAAERTRTLVSMASANLALMGGVSRDREQLFLANNLIKTVPKELCGLQNLTVLILRNNQITHIPPEIVRLVNLTTLSIAGNKIEYLPSEMLQMHLQTISLHPNPFLSPPLPAGGNPEHGPLQLRPVSAPRFCFKDRVPPLTEIALRMLMTPLVVSSIKKSMAPEPHETMLSNLYELPLLCDLPVMLRETVRACVPNAIVGPKDFCNTRDGLSGIGVCGNPSHDRPRIFVRPAEERYSWELRIATQSAGGLVPVRWRGCMRGCLDFLNPEETTDRETADRELESMGSTIDSFAVHTVDTGGALDFDD